MKKMISLSLESGIFHINSHGQAYEKQKELRVMYDPEFEYILDFYLTPLEKEERLPRLKVVMDNFDITAVQLEKLRDKLFQVKNISEIVIRNCNLDREKLYVIASLIKDIKTLSFSITLEDEPSNLANENTQIIWGAAVCKAVNSNSPIKSEITNDSGKFKISYKRSYDVSLLIGGALIGALTGGVVGVIAGFIKAKFFHSPLNKFNLSNGLFGVAIIGVSVAGCLLGFLGAKRHQEGRLFSDRKSSEQQIISQNL